MLRGSQNYSVPYRKNLKLITYPKPMTHHHIYVRILRFLVD